MRLSATSETSSPSKKVWRRNPAAFSNRDNACCRGKRSAVAAATELREGMDVPFAEQADADDAVQVSGATTTVTQLVDTLSGALGVEWSRVNRCSRVLREAGLLPTSRAGIAAPIGAYLRAKRRCGSPLCHSRAKPSDHRRRSGVHPACPGPPAPAWRAAVSARAARSG